ncbi:MAG: trimethylamine methyltransferase family protein [Planctomycetota bacterium]|jgi:trimethylamine--corrinoid protein Co-methyltransferase
MRPTVRFLSDDLIERILEQAYRLLQDKGINLNHDPLLQRLADAGCRVDMDQRRVWLTREIVESSVRSAPGRVELWNVAGTTRCDLSGDNVHFTPGSAAIRMLDHATNRMRPATDRSVLHGGGARRRAQPHR